jgi:hypothetical protein
MKNFKPKLLAANDIIGVHEVENIITNDFYSMRDFIDTLPLLDNSETIYSYFDDKKLYAELKKNYGIIEL